MSGNQPGGNGEPRSARPPKPDLDDLEAIEFDAKGVDYGRLLLLPAVGIGLLLLLALAIKGLNFLGPY